MTKNERQILLELAKAANDLNSIVLNLVQAQPEDEKKKALIETAKSATNHISEVANLMLKEWSE